MREPSRIFRWAAVLCTMVAASGPAKGQSEKAFWKIYGQATSAAHAAHWEEAKRAWLQAHTMAPASLNPLYGLAAASARLNRADEAFEWLEKALSAGMWSREILEGDADLDSLHADSRWEPLLGRMQARATETMARRDARRPELDPSSAPPFKSYRKLAATFDRSRWQLYRDSWRLSSADYSARGDELRDRRLAAVRRYLRDHSDAPDREGAAWDIVTTRMEYRYPFDMDQRWGDSGRQALEDLEAYLKAFPAGTHRGDALTDRAFVAFHLRPEGGTAERPWREDDVRLLDQVLASVARDFTGTTAGGVALARRLAVADRNSAGDVTPEMRGMRGELAEVYASDRTVMELMKFEVRAPIVRIDGLTGFDGVDQSGTHWTGESFKGKVTLIDFWATWCGPCVDEIPTLRKAWAAFRDRGFQMLGVSLDQDDQATFNTWLKSNGVEWPQIWDGKGWESALAKRFDVHGIPFTVLIDRDGRVAAVDLRGERLRARIARLVDPTPSAPEAKAAPVP